MTRLVVSNLLGLAGAVLGGVAGFFTFQWLYGHGFYGLAIPGAFAGLGCGLLAQHRSVARGVVCGLGGLGLSLFTEWWFFGRSVNDGSFLAMLKNLQNQGPVTLLMIAIGTLIAFWVGQDAGFRLMPWSRSAPPGAREPAGPSQEV